MCGKSTRMLGLRLRKDSKETDRPPPDVLVAGDAMFSPTGQDHTRQQARLNDDPRDDQCLKAIARLPAVFRSAMILSYLEGFTTEEIARLAGVQPHAIKSLLVRGRELMQEEFLAYVKKEANMTQGLSEKVRT